MLAHAAAAEDVLWPLVSGGGAAAASSAIEQIVNIWSFILGLKEVS